MLCLCSKRASPSRRLSTSSIDRGLQRCCQEGDIDEAVLRLSSADSCPPSYLSYLSLLKACNSSKNLAHLRHVHIHLALHGLHHTDALGNPLVVTLAKCGELKEAITLLHSLAHRTLFSWTAIISANIELGCASDALHAYIHMLNDGIQPDLYTFVCLFKAYGIIGNVTEGMRMHADAHKKGLTSNGFAGSSLVSMYGKCGALAEAEQVFAEMSKPDMVSWLAMLSVYVDLGCAIKALLLYRQMHEEGQNPTGLCFVRVLQACRSLEEDEDACVLLMQSVKLAAFDIGQAVHAESCRQQFASDVFIGSAVVSMYGKCGSIAHAENAFCRLPVQDLATWNSLLSAYIERDQAFTALQLYVELHERGMVPSKLSLVIGLQACAALAEEEEEQAEEEEEEKERGKEEEEVSGEKGKLTKAAFLSLVSAFRDDAVRKCLMSDVLVGSTLINLYGKCGNILEAEYLFRELVSRNVVSWTAMMSAYLEQGKGDNVLQLYRQMQAERMVLDEHTYVLVIQACSILEKPEISSTRGSILVVEIGQALHSEIRSLGFATNIFISTALITMYSKHGSLAEAENAFSGLCVHNVISWTALISAYAEQRDMIKALQSYQKMLSAGIDPDGPTFILALQACTVLLDKEDGKLQGQIAEIVCLEIGRGLHADCVRLGWALDITIAGSLISMYGKCGSIVHAENVFNALPANNAVLSGSIISAFIETGLNEKAIGFYRHMVKMDFAVDDAVFCCILKACSDIGILEFCQEVHFSVASAGLDSNLNLANSLVHTYGSCGSLADVHSIANGFSRMDIVSWSACIAAFAQGGNSTCLKVLLSMHVEGNELGAAAFLSVLTCCSHVGLTDEGFRYFISMREDYGITLLPKHYLVLTDLLGRAGDYRRIKDFVWQSPIINDASLWLVLLAACSRQGNVELGGLAFDRILTLEPKESAAYVLMANALTPEEEPCCIA